MAKRKWYSWVYVAGVTSWWGARANRSCGWPANCDVVSKSLVVCITTSTCNTYWLTIRSNLAVSYADLEDACNWGEVTKSWLYKTQEWLFGLILYKNDRCIYIVSWIFNIIKQKTTVHLIIMFPHHNVSSSYTLVLYSCSNNEVDRFNCKTGELCIFGP